MRVVSWLNGFLLLAVLALAAPSQAQMTTQQFLEQTGTACLVGGTALGIGALLTGGTTLLPVLGFSGTASPWLVSAMSGVVGCGLGGATSIVYSGLFWTYEAFFAEPLYPLLYPAREDMGISGGEPGRTE